jgi:hypothetical protein
MSLLMNNNSKKLIWVAVAALLTACQTTPQKDQPGITVKAKHVAEAQRLVDYFSSAEVADTIAATGLEPVNAE